MSKYLTIWISSIVVLGFLVVSSFSNPIPRNSVLCVQTNWENILVFYAINYLAHAGSIPSEPEAKGSLGIGNWILGSNMRWKITALLFPFAGLLRSLLWITNTINAEDEVIRALGVGAAMVVGRSESWTPHKQEQWIYVKLPKSFKELDETKAVKFVFDNDQGQYEISPAADQIHGSMQLPPGYIWVTSAMDLVRDIAPMKDVRLSRSQSGMKMAISIAQLIYSSITIYRTRGDQINHYGYAAFGLSVFPFTIMSLFNFICVGLVGEYASIYAIRTTIMQEAEEQGGRFNGAIGFPRKLGENDHPGASTPMEGYDVVLMSMEDEKLVVTVEEHTKKFRFQTDEYDVQELCLPSAIDDNGSDSSDVGGALTLFATIPLLIIPHIFIFLLTGYKKNHSTIAQRAWMLSWVCANQLSLFFYFMVLIIPRGDQTILQIMWAILFASPAIGGYVEVGMMLKQFGSCSVVPS